MTIPEGLVVNITELPGSTVFDSGLPSTSRSRLGAVFVQVMVRQALWRPSSGSTVRTESEVALSR
jgi:hypothetical protein